MDDHGRNDSLVGRPARGRFNLLPTMIANLVFRGRWITLLTKHPGTIMSQRTLTNEAADCRSWAHEFEGRPEKAFLLKLASEFENLARAATQSLGVQENDRLYFAQRASQEVTAAVQAKHPIARLAHLRMAQRYDALTHNSGPHGASSGQA